MAIWTLLWGLMGCGPSDDAPADTELSPPAPQEVVDTTVLAPPEPVDVLFVMGQRPSMTPVQEALANDVDAMLGVLVERGIDHHVSVITTDGSDAGELVVVDGHRFVSAETPDAAAVLAEMIRVGSNGANEAGLASIYAALELEPSFEDGSFRPEATLRTLIVTDTDDASPVSTLTVDEFVRWYDGLEQGVDRRTLDVVGPPLGGRYQDAVERLGGTYTALDEVEWDEFLAGFGDLAARTTQEVFLSQPAVPDTIEVRARQIADDAVLQLRSDEWTYDLARNSVTLDADQLSTFDQVELSYQAAAAAR
ncbi:MAG: hypothetical protein AAF211_07845 [Myxococcota bacterium]